MFSNFHTLKMMFYCPLTSITSVWKSYSCWSFENCIFPAPCLPTYKGFFLTVFGFWQCKKCLLFPAFVLHFLHISPNVLTRVDCIARIVILRLLSITPILNPKRKPGPWSCLQVSVRRRHVAYDLLSPSVPFYPLPSLVYSAPATLPALSIPWTRWLYSTQQPLG